MAALSLSSRMRSLKVTAFFLFFGSWAGETCHALPTPPDKIIQDKIVRISLGTHSRLAISGHDLELSGQSQFSGDSFFNLRCGIENGSGAAYVEYGAGKRALGRLTIVAPSGFLQFNNQLFRDRLVIIPKGHSCLVVNTLGLESYIVGVIGKEMSPSWPLEALKAQAVASRSYALHQIEANRNKEFDLEASTQDQVYDGMRGESARAAEAVDATRSIVLSYNQQPLKAYFHANCGGITEVPEFVWGGEIKAFRQVVCPYHRRSRDRSAWKLRLSRLQIEHALRKISGLLPKNFFRLASLEAGAPNLSMRLTDLSLSDTSGNNILVNTSLFRTAIGNSKIKSTAFQIQRDAEGYLLSGEGNGHGVGLCQVGARAMAEEGRNFRQILQFYYPLSRIKTL